jgi:hypothetical protein
VQLSSSWKEKLTNVTIIRKNQEKNEKTGALCGSREKAACEGDGRKLAFSVSKLANNPRKIAEISNGLALNVRRKMLCGNRG